MALQRAATLYPINSTTVDTGAGIDVRALSDTEPGATDSNQNIDNASQGTNIERTVDPATNNPSLVNNAATTAAKIGYAIPTTGMDTGESRCSAILKAQTVTVAFHGAASGTGTGTGNDVLTPRASLWKYNPSTDTQTLIAGASGSAISKSAAFAYSDSTYDASVAITVASDVVFASGEVLMVQFGGNVACSAGFLGSARQTVWAVHVDLNTTSVTFGTSGLRQSCAESASAALSLTPTYGRRLTMHRTFSGAVAFTSAFEDLLTMHRSFVAALSLTPTYGRLLTLHRSFAGAVALAGALTRKIIPIPKTGAISFTGQRQPWTIRLGRADLAGALDLGAVFAKGLHKQITGALSLSGAFARRVTSRRTFTGALTLDGSWAVKMSQTVLNRIASGGTTVIKKVFALFD